MDRNPGAGSVGMVTGKPRDVRNNDNRWIRPSRREGPVSSVGTLWYLVDGPACVAVRVDAIDDLRRVQGVELSITRCS